MSSFVLNQGDINLLTMATDAMLRMNSKYCASYPLEENTIKLLGKYKGDLHNIYRILFITNIKAVNGRYGENDKTFPRYQEIRPWDIDRIDICKLKEAAGMFQCYKYQITEEPVYKSEIYNAIVDIYKLLCMILVSKTIDWYGDERE